MEKIAVAILGATGTVGQKFIALLANHPWFEVAELVASEKSAGKPYRSACSWREHSVLPTRVASRIVKDIHTNLDSPVLFSALDSSVAKDAEAHYAHKGHIVISNASSYRLDPLVPLVIPEINSSHLPLIHAQPYQGAIVTNPNCSTIFLSMVLAPLHAAVGVKKAMVTTMQAISGAGYPGVPSLDIVANVVPYIPGEEEKIEHEPLKILGTFNDTAIKEADLVISAQCNRVPVIDGHTESISLKLNEPISIKHVKELLSNFGGEIKEMDLPSAPPAPIIVTDDVDGPQTRDIYQANGMATVVGRIQTCALFDVKMVALGHNTIRGAAGAAILNAEACCRLGLLEA